MKSPRKIIRKAAVCERVGLAPATVWRKSNDPDDDFPASVQLGPCATGWYEHEIDAWIESRPRGGGQRKPHLERHYNRKAKDEAQPEAARCHGPR